MIDKVLGYSLIGIGVVAASTGLIIPAAVAYGLVLAA